MAAIINSSRIVRTYSVEVEGKHYRVVHTSWTRPPSKPPVYWSSEQVKTWVAPPTEGESWAVYSTVGIHSGVHECAPEKPTYKRVVAAVKAAIASPSMEAAA